MQVRQPQQFREWCTLGIIGRGTGSRLLYSRREALCLEVTVVPRAFA